MFELDQLVLFLLLSTIFAFYVSHLLFLCSLELIDDIFKVWLNDLYLVLLEQFFDEFLKLFSFVLPDVFVKTKKASLEVKQVV